MDETIDQVLRGIDELRRYRRDLIVIRLFVVAFLVVSVMSPTVVAFGLAVAAAIYASFYRHHIGWRWVLFPACFAALYAASAIIWAAR